MFKKSALLFLALAITISEAQDAFLDDDDLDNTELHYLQDETIEQEKWIEAYKKDEKNED